MGKAPKEIEAPEGKVTPEMVMGEGDRFNDTAVGALLCKVVALDEATGKYSFDAIMLFEATVAAANDERYLRNSPLQTLMRGFAAEQRGIRELQARLDGRAAERAKNAAEAKEREKVEAKQAG